VIWVTIVFIAAALAVVPVSRRLTGDFLSPAALVVVVWFTSLGLYFLFLIPYEPLHRQGLLYILGAVGSLVVGILLGTWAMFRRRARGPIPEEEGAPDIRRLERWIVAYSGLGVAGFVWYLVGVVRYLGWGALRNGGVIRQALGAKVIPSEFLFLEFFCVIAPLVTLASLVAGVRIRARVLVLPAVCVLFLWLSTDRTQFFTVALAGTWMYLFRFGPQLSLPQYVRAVAIAGVLLVLNFWSVGAWTGKTPTYLSAMLKERALQTQALRGTFSETLPGVRWSRRDLPQGRQDWLLQKFSYVYLYATGSYPAFSGFVTSEVERTYGAHTFFPVLRALNRIGLYSGILPDPIPPFRMITRKEVTWLGFNGYTFLWYYYHDFGPAGILVVPFLIGGVTGVVYGRLRSCRSSPVLLLLMGHLSTALMLSIFVSKFNNTASWYVGLFSVLPFLRIRRPQVFASSAAPESAASGL
jgi:hypothetical protein